MIRMILPAACIAAFCGSLLTNMTAQAQTPETRCCVACEVGVPMLSKLPYVGKLFKNVCGPSEPATSGNIQILWAEDVACPTAKCAGGKACHPQCFIMPGSDGFERIGIDFEANVCAEPNCSQCAQCTLPGNATTVVTSDEQVPALVMELYSSLTEQMNRLQLRSVERDEEMIEALIEARVENAKLTAELAAAKEQTTLAVENALLKAKLEQMEERLAKFEQEQSAIAEKATKRKR